MPMLSNFYGITIKMFFKQVDHSPPHIHAIYGEYIGIIDIKTCKMINGDLPNNALKLVKKWVIIHKLELINMWNTQSFHSLAPLE